MSPRFSAVLDRGRSASGPQVPASPPAVRVQRRWWRDARVIGGAMLIVVCMLVGVRLTTLGPEQVQVWQVQRDLSAGTSLTIDDLVAVPVETDLAEVYLSAGVLPEGRLVRDIRAGELLTAADTNAVAIADARWVSVPVEPLHAPADLAIGDRVDVWSTPDPSRDLTAIMEPRLVLPGVLVVGIDVEARGFAGDYGVIVEVDPELAGEVLTAVRGGTIDLVRVPVGAAS